MTEETQQDLLPDEKKPRRRSKIKERQELKREELKAQLLVTQDREENWYCYVHKLPARGNDNKEYCAKVHGKVIDEEYLIENGFTDEYGFGRYEVSYTWKEGEGDWDGTTQVLNIAEPRSKQAGGANLPALAQAIAGNNGGGTSEKILMTMLDAADKRAAQAEARFEKLLMAMIGNNNNGGGNQNDMFKFMVEQQNRMFERMEDNMHRVLDYKEAKDAEMVEQDQDTFDKIVNKLLDNVDILINKLLPGDAVKAMIQEKLPAGMDLAAILQDKALVQDIYTEIAEERGKDVADALLNKMGISL